MAGCSGKKQSATPTNEEIVTEIKNPVERTFWHAMNGDQEKSLQGLVDNFQKENPEYKSNSSKINQVILIYNKR